MLIFWGQVRKVNLLNSGLLPPKSRKYFFMDFVWSTVRYLPIYFRCPISISFNNELIRLKVPISYYFSFLKNMGGNISPEYFCSMYFTLYFLNQFPMSIPYFLFCYFPTQFKAWIRGRKFNWKDEWENKWALRS